MCTPFPPSMLGTSAFLFLVDSTTGCCADVQQCGHQKHAQASKLCLPSDSANLSSYARLLWKMPDEKAPCGRDAFIKMPGQHMCWVYTLTWGLFSLQKRSLSVPLGEGGSPTCAAHHEEARVQLHAPAVHGGVAGGARRSAGATLHVPSRLRAEQPECSNVCQR